MRIGDRAPRCYCAIVLFAIALGCGTPRVAHRDSAVAIVKSPRSVGDGAEAVNSAGASACDSNPGESAKPFADLSVHVTSFAQAASEEPSPTARPVADDNHLELEPLVTEVLSLNPDIRSAFAAWRAAAQRCPQAISLDDPMFGYMLGPGSWGNGEVESAYTLEASQKLPWPGKRALRGRIARAEANAAYFEAEEQRLQIAELTRMAYFEYFLAHRQLAVLRKSSELLQSFREIALRKYEAAEAQQQDVLLADVELAQLERRGLELIRTEQVARARINTLLLVAPDSPLPPPPPYLLPPEPLPPVSEFLESALVKRPELAAQAARVRRERYSAALARKEFLPDMEFVARYDAFWQEEPLRPMVGMNVNVPIYKQKRWAAVREADARSAQQQATLESQVYEILFEVEQAYRRVQESEESLRVYQEKLLPTARHSVEAAEANYVAGRLDFLRLIESQRSLLLLEAEYYVAMAQYHQRLAELSRQAGRTAIR